MTDKTVAGPSDGGPKRFVDMGDGSYAELVEAVGANADVGASFTRPADTTAYASGDLVAAADDNAARQFQRPRRLGLLRATSCSARSAPATGTSSPMRSCSSSTSSARDTIR